MFRQTPALVLREVRYNEADRILTLLTKTEGLITAKARGALRKSSRIAAPTQQLVYSDMTLFGNKGKWLINEAAVIEPFIGLREDFAAFSLGSYFAQCIESLAVEDQPDEELLQLGLNSLYALSNGLYRHAHIKAAFELRLMCLAGYAPELHSCAVCGREPAEPFLSLKNGTVMCRACGSSSSGKNVPLCKESLAAMRHVCTAPAKKIMAFKISDGALDRLAYASEEFLLARTERRFQSLDYYKKINGFN